MIIIYSVLIIVLCLFVALAAYETEKQLHENDVTAYRGMEEGRDADRQELDRFWIGESRKRSKRVPVFLVRHGGVVSLEGLDHATSIMWPRMDLINWKQLCEFWDNCDRDYEGVYVLMYEGAVVGVCGCKTVAENFAELSGLCSYRTFSINNVLADQMRRAGIEK